MITHMVATMNGLLTMIDAYPVEISYLTFNVEVWIMTKQES